MVKISDVVERSESDDKERLRKRVRGAQRKAQLFVQEAVKAMEKLYEKGEPEENSTTVNNSVEVTQKEEERLELTIKEF